MIKRVVYSCLCGSLVAIASVANAQSTHTIPLLGEIHPTPYIQGALGIEQIYSPGATGMTINLNGSTTATTPSVRGTVGLQLNQYVGVEGTWFQLPSISVNTSVGGAEYKGDAYVASVTGSYPLPMNISLQGRIGLGNSDVSVTVPNKSYSSSSQQQLLVWGAGARFNINKLIDMTIDYDNLGTVSKYARGDAVTVEMVSLGMRYKF